MAVDMSDDGAEGGGAETRVREAGAADAPREEPLRGPIVRLLRESLTASLATLDAATGFPHASLVEVAVAGDGRPLLLLSDLARHTRNLMTDARASLLYDRRGGDGPLALERVTALGAATRLTGASPADERQRYLRRHPGAQRWVDLGDFAFWSLAPERFHFIGGFGRIREVGAGAAAPSARAGGASAEMIGSCLDRINGLLAAESNWRVVDVHADGIDLVTRWEPRVGRLVEAPAALAMLDDPQALAALVDARIRVGTQ